MDCNKFEAMTNADWIRNMSDEELADYLFYIVTHSFIFCEEKEDWIKWLQQPRKVEE